MNAHHPLHPIVYVRGVAATEGEIEDTVADPYMGFNVGSTKIPFDKVLSVRESVAPTASPEPQS